MTWRRRRDGRLRFHARVAVNMLAIVERELVLGPAQAEAHAERLARLGVADDAELARRIRAGELDDRLDEVKAAVAASVRDKLTRREPPLPRHPVTGLCQAAPHA